LLINKYNLIIISVSHKIGFLPFGVLLALLLSVRAGLLNMLLAK
jgi:hypothetical protein